MSTLKLSVGSDIVLVLNQWIEISRSRHPASTLFAPREFGRAGSADVSFRDVVNQTGVKCFLQPRDDCALEIRSSCAVEASGGLGQAASDARGRKTTVEMVLRRPLQTP